MKTTEPTKTEKKIAEAKKTVETFLALPKLSKGLAQLLKDARNFEVEIPADAAGDEFKVSSLLCDYSENAICTTIANLASALGVSFDEAAALVAE